MYGMRRRPALRQRCPALRRSFRPSPDPMPSPSSPSSLPLTARQQEILDWIRRHFERTGMPPTRAEIAAGLGFSTASSAEDHLRALARKGALEILPGSSRGLRLKDMPAVAGLGLP